MSGISTYQSLSVAVDITYRARSLAAVIADLAGSIDERAGKNALLDKERLGQIIHLAEIVEGYCGDTAMRLEYLARQHRPS